MGRYSVTGRSLRRRQGQGESESVTPFEGRINPDHAPVGLDYAPADGEARGPSRPRSSSAVQPVELVEYALPLVERE